MRFTILSLIALCCVVQLLYSQAIDPVYNPAFYARADISQAVFDSKGNTYFLGDFDQINGKFRSGLGKLGIYEQLDEDFDIGTGFNGEILKLLVLPNDKLLVAGSFTEFNGVETGPLALLNENGSLNQTFGSATNIVSQSETPIANVIELADGRLLVYGSFSSYKGFVTNSIVILTAGGSVVQSFSHQNEELLSVLHAAPQSSGKLVVLLQTSNSQSGQIIRLNADGTKDETFNDFDTVTQKVHKIMTQSSDKILVLTDVPGANEPSVDLFRLNADGTSDDSFNLGEGIVGFFDDFQVESDDAILIGSVSVEDVGNYGTIDGNNTGFISRIWADGEFDKTFVSRNYSESSRVALSRDGDIYIHGKFSSVSDHYARGIARFNNVDQIDGSYRPDISSLPETVLVEKRENGSIVIPFFNDPFENASYLRKLGDQWDWIRRQDAPPFVVKEIRVVKAFPWDAGGQTVYAGGPRGSTGQNIFILNSDGGRESFYDYTFGTGFNDNYVNDLESDSDFNYVIVGSFSGSQGQTEGLAGIVKVDVNGQRVNGFTSPFSADSVKITDVEVQQDGKLMLAGVYAPAGETNLKNGLVRLNADGSFDETFDRTLNFSGGVIEKIEIVSDGYIVVGGFTDSNTAARKGIAKINLDGTLNQAFNGDNSLVGNKAHHVVVEGDAIYVGGDFTAYQGKPVHGLIRLGLDGKMDESFQLPATLSALVRDFEVFPDDEINITMAGKFYDSLRSRKLTAVRLSEDINGIPTELTIENISAFAVNLSWQTSSTNEENFIIERSKNDQENFQVIGTADANTTTYEDDQFNETGINYYYRVRASKGNFRSEYTNVVEAAVPQRPLAAPFNVTIYFASAALVTLRWEDSNFDETGFTIERSVNDQQNFVEIGTVAANAWEYEDETVNGETTYYYRIKADRGDESSEYSTVVEVTTPVHIPAAPSNLTGTLVSTNRIDLTWSDNSEKEDNFIIYRQVNAMGWSVLTTLPKNQTSFSDSNFTPGQGLDYYIVASNSSGSSDGSNIISMSTGLPPDAPSNLTGVLVSENRIDLTWRDNSDDEFTFEVMRSVNDQGGVRLVSVPANQTIYSDTNFGDAQKLEYWILARNSSGDSPPSNILSIVIASIGEGLPGQDDRFDFSFDPVSHELSFKLNNLADKIRGYQVVSGTGVMKMREEGLAAQQLNLSMSGTTAGVYLLHVTSGGNKYVVKFIKK